MNTRAIILLLAATLPVVLPGATYIDDFDDGMIDETFWEIGDGDGVSEASGVLNFARDEPSDYIVSRAQFGAPFDISFEMQMIDATFTDTFHGIRLSESPRLSPGWAFGFGFGFSNYDRFFSVREVPSGAGYQYGPLFTPETWYQLRVVGDGTTIEFYVNNGLTFSYDTPYMKQFYVHLPGHYNSGNDVGGSPSLSQIDNFMLDARVVPEPSSTVLLAVSSLLWCIGILSRFSTRRGKRIS